MRYIFLLVLASSLTVDLAGCTTAQATAMVTNSPPAIEQLQVISAGHTGCLPDDNQIAVVWVKPDGSSLWKATCKSKVYLCSSVKPPDGSQTYSCAPQAQ